MMDWEQLETSCLACQKCKLCKTRTNVVLGDGNKNANIMLIGEGPGYQEDLQGKPFVGPAGQLLDKMLASIGLDRSNVYITNVVKCRPPKNRDPEPEESAACLNYLRSQLLLLQPKLLVCLGRVAAQIVISPDFRITRQHGSWYHRKGYWLTATYHPSALLRDNSKKRPTYEDLLQIKDKIASLSIL